MINKKEKKIQKNPPKGEHTLSCKTKINIFNIANYIIENNIFPVTQMKMNKMIYYAYAKSLVEYNEPLVTEEMQAWIYEPVFPTLTKFLKKIHLPTNTHQYHKMWKSQQINRSTKNHH
ncbi:MAG: hypothetical protein WJU30_00501 [Candidatus Phytoplasma pruni]